MEEAAAAGLWSMMSGGVAHDYLELFAPVGLLSVSREDQSGGDMSANTHKFSVLKFPLSPMLCSPRQRAKQSGPSSPPGGPWGARPWGDLWSLLLVLRRGARCGPRRGSAEELSSARSDGGRGTETSLLLDC
ncbi:unnamed protein product [Gadus morhua 'NCC']